MANAVLLKLENKVKLIRKDRMRIKSMQTVIKKVRALLNRIITETKRMIRKMVKKCISCKLNPTISPIKKTTRL